MNTPMEIDRAAPVQATAELVIEAPPEVVWATLADIASWPEWNPDVARAALNGALAAGTTFSWKAGGMAIESQLVAVMKPGTLGWTGRTFGTRAVHMSFFKAHERGTRAVTEESFAGPLPWLLRGMMRKMLKRSLASGLEVLKAEAERRASSAPPAPRT
ncbi:MAG: SRPBCC family protein [Deltaproteobacteria bacterium]|nr:SRPBCC family protein [Deltaproteobacteria bacterium]